MILDPEIMDFGPRRQTGGNQPLCAEGLAREENYYFCPLILDLGSWTLDLGSWSLDSMDFVDPLNPQNPQNPWSLMHGSSLYRSVAMSIGRYVDLSLCLDPGSWIMDPMI